MRKISSLIMVLVLMASSLAGNTWFLEAVEETADLGIKVVNKDGAPIEGAFVRITQRAELTPDPQSEGSYIQGPFADLAEPVEVSTNASGEASFQLPYPYEYKVQVEKQVGEGQEPYHVLNFSVGNITESGSNQQVVMYQEVQVIRVQNPVEGEKTVAATKTSEPNGVNIVLNQTDIAQILAGATHYYAYFIEELWDVSTMGLPYNYLNASASM